MKSYVNPRFFFRSLFVSFGLIALLQSCAEGQAPTVPANGPTLGGLIEEWRRKVVLISCRDPSSKVYASGSGFLIKDDNGDIYVVTNRHVLKDGLGKKHNEVLKGWSILATFDDGETVELGLIGASGEIDIAVLRIIDRTDTDLESFSFVKGKVKVGTKVVALGYPLNKGFYCTEGIVSADGRPRIGAHKDALFNLYLAHTAATNHGNSGGPVVISEEDENRGRVAAVNTLMQIEGADKHFMRIEGCNLAVPSDVIERVIADLIQGKPFQRPALGVFVGDVLQLRAIEHNIYMKGAVVMGFSSEDENCVAFKAGLQKRDIILKVGGVDVENHFRLQKEILLYRLNDKVEITYYRLSSKELMKVTITLSRLFKKDDFMEKRVFGLSKKNPGLIT